MPLLPTTLQWVLKPLLLLTSSPFYGTEYEARNYGYAGMLSTRFIAIAHVEPKIFPGMLLSEAHQRYLQPV